MDITLNDLLHMDVENYFTCFFYCIHFNKSIYVTLKRPYNKHKTSDIRSNIDSFLVRSVITGKFQTSIVFDVLTELNNSKVNTSRPRS